MRQKEKSPKTEELFANITYYKLRAEKHLGYYIIDPGDENYRVGGVGEILDQALIISRVSGGWSSTRKKPKIVAGVGLCSNQRHSSTMMNDRQSDLPNTVRDVMQANHWDGASGIDESYCILRGQSGALQLDRQI